SMSCAVLAASPGVMRGWTATQLPKGARTTINARASPAMRLAVRCDLASGLMLSSLDLGEGSGGSAVWAAVVRWRYDGLAAAPPAGARGWILGGSRRFAS